MPASDGFSRRAPLLRFAAFLRPRRFRARLGAAGPVAALALLLGVSASVAPLSGAPENRPAGRQGSPPATLKVGAVAYTEAKGFFSKLGYSEVKSAEAEDRVLTLQSGGSVLILSADSREARVNGLRVFLGEGVLMDRGVFYVSSIDCERFLLPILRPARFTPRPLHTIVIDAGHGGTDTGTRNQPHKLDEKTFTLDVAARLQTLLAGGHWKVLMTRSDDRFIGLAERAEFANQAKADLFISIHFNAVANNPAVRGTETYVLTPQHQRSTSSLMSSSEDKVAQAGNVYDAWNAVLGYHMHRELLAKLKTEDRGYKRARFAVLRLVECPAVLVEAGYLSNDAEAQRIGTAAYRADIAEALFVAVQAYDATLAAAAKP